jgi:diguanylate cyclase (GGDEF)-like protein
MKERPHAAAWRITRIYLIMGCLWILLSDRIVELLAADTAAFRTLSHIKGWLYVGATAALLYTLIKSYLCELETAQHRALQGYHELAAAHQALEDANMKLEEHQEQLRRMAHHDHLTGLPNRRALFQTLSDVLSQEGSCGAVFFTDLDNFKYINDSIGHVAGDELLTRISMRLQEALSPAWHIFRLGGDEFILVLPEAKPLDVEEHARKLHALMGEPFSLKEATVHVTCSTGIALYPAHGNTPENLIKRADIALNRAKDEPASSFAVFDESMEEAMKERLELDQALRMALKKREFTLLYQPQYELATGRISGFEALLRWTRDDGSTVSPAKFIPIAEQSGVIVNIGKWVLSNACRFLRKLHELGYTHLTMSVNVSVLELIHPGYVDKATEIVRSQGLSPQDIELEITESALMESNGLAEAQLFLLKDRGFGIALDDFGTGYSSLNYLRKLPITTLKIDKDFIAAINSSEELSLVGEMIKIGKMMGISVIAEGVEDHSQVEFLTQHHCDKIQGFLFSKPVPEAEAIAKLQAPTA